MNVWPRTVLLVSALGLSLAACDRKAPGGAEADGAASAPSASDPASAGSGSWLARRDPSARQPPRPIPRVVSSTSGVATRPPDWDLDPSDPARDYVRRYVFFTRRYGDSVLACADIGASTPDGARQRVQVMVKAGCPNAGTERDVFLVDVAKDRLSVDDKNKRDPLTRWPDGSDPEGPRSETMPDLIDLRKWNGALSAAFRSQSLVPVRVQTYGRGTYPVISIAAWHGAAQADAPPDVLLPLAQALCQGNAGMPLGLLAAVDRSKILRVRCPATTAWDNL